jgi:dihydroflavonol-4-reductase
MTTPTRTAFVTGSTGFLGVNLIGQLVDQGWNVVALHRASSNLKYLQRFNVTRVQGIIEDLASLEAAMPQGVDVVFHTAADVSFWSRHRERQRITNVDGTRNVVSTALKRGVKKLVCTSTTAVYGFATGYDETAPHLGRDSWFSYMATKTAAEDEVRKGIQQGLDACFINPANIVGPYDLHNWSRLIRLAVERKLPRLPPGRGSFCHVREVARAHISAADRGRTGENYITAGADASFADLVRTIGEIIGQPVQVKTVPLPMLRFAGRVLGLIARFTGKEPLVTLESAAFLSADLTCKCDKAVRELGYQPVPLREMLEDSYRWMVAEGLLPAAR